MRVGGIVRVGVVVGVIVDVIVGLIEGVISDGLLQTPMYEEV